MSELRNEESGVRDRHDTGAFNASEIDDEPLLENEIFIAVRGNDLRTCHKAQRDGAEGDNIVVVLSKG